MSKRANERPARAPGPRPGARPAARWVRATLASGSLAILALALLLNFPPSGAWWLEMVRYAPLPLLLVPVSLMVLLAWRAGRGWRLLALATLALTLTEVMGLVVGRGDEGSGEFRFMTYNVKSYLAARGAGGFGPIAWEIASQDPDVVVLEDAQTIPERPAAAAAVRAALAGRQTYVMGQYIVASRFPMKDCAEGTMSISEDTDDYVHCTLTIHGREVDVLVAHLISPRVGLNAARGQRPGGLDAWERNFGMRLTQAGLLVRGIVHAAHPVIVAGDLNADERSPVVQQLLATGLRDAFSSAGRGYGYTYGHDLRPGFSFLRIDHVLVGKSIGVRDCIVGGRDGSEHRPVIADLLIERR